MPNQYTHKLFYSETHKECSRCRNVKEHSEFHKNKNNINSGGLTVYCKDCANYRARKWHSENIHKPDVRERKRDSHFKTTYGISLEQYKQKLIDQGNRCGICSIPLEHTGKLTHLDHDHSTGILRDFLCTNCNRGLGSFHDDTEKLMKAIEYLNKHRGNAEPEGRADVYE